MRILINTTFLVSEKTGGSWIYTHNLLRGLERCAKDVEIILLVSRSMAEGFAQLSFERRIVRMDPSSRWLRVGWEQLVLPRIARFVGCDIFHSTGNVLPRRLACRSIVTVHDFQYFYYPGNFSSARRAYLRWAVPASMERADRVVCISEATKSDALRLYPIREEKIAVIHLGGLWDGEHDIASRASVGIRNRYNLTAPVLLCVGSALPHKNLKRLIGAFSLIAGNVPHDLVVVGEPFLFGRELQESVQHELGAQSNRVRFTGFVDRESLLGLYRIADALVFPSFFEGFGIPAVEAMQSGCPVIAARGAALSEVIGSAGEFFDPLDVNDMALAIKKVCTDETLRSDMRRRGSIRSEAFSWEKMARQTLDVYRQTFDRSEQHELNN